MTRTDRDRHFEDTWSADAAALGRATARSLPDIDSTAAALAAADRNHKEEPTMMQSLKSRPILATAVAAAALLILAPASYAVVNRVLLDVDPRGSEADIEADVREQLEAAGLQNAEVSVDKDGGDTATIEIVTDDRDGPEIDVAGHDVPESGLEVRLEGQSALDQERQDELKALASSQAYMKVVKRAFELSSDEFIAKMDRFLADRGFPEAEVYATGERRFVVEVR